jgi:glycosyltransferase involved in cell wall biosynthesis
MKISVIMPVSLTPWIGCASNLEYKFQRAIGTYLEQDFDDSELIVVSDGCDQAEKIYMKNYLNTKVRFRKIEKQVPFSGTVRQVGINISRGDIVCYLDADDIFGKKHLQVIHDNFDTDKYDWIYYDDYVIMDANFNYSTRCTSIAYARIGTSSIAHKKDIHVIWGDGYAHDWRLIETYLVNRPCIKIETPQYYVCHTPTGLDF